MLEIDPSSLASVRTAAEEVRAQTQTLNVLVANAGIMACPQAYTADGFESQLATNYLGHFLLFQLLRDRLLRSATPAFASRVVNVSSSGHHAGGVNFDDLQLKAEGAYSPWGAYGQSKTAMIYMTNEIERRYGARGLHGLALMPGGIMTGLQVHVPDEQKKVWTEDPAVTKFMKDAAQGAATTVDAAVGKAWEGAGGKYLEDNADAEPFQPGWDGKKGVKPHAFDEEKEKRLWPIACKLVGVSDE